MGHFLLLNFFSSYFSIIFIKDCALKFFYLLSKNTTLDLLIFLGNNESLELNYLAKVSIRWKKN